MRLLCVIPARLGSTRLAHKPLRLIAGEPLIRRVVRNVLALDLGADVVVAADDERVLAAVGGLAPGVLTRGDHASGTSRVGEAIAQDAYAGYDVVLNVQGDEPFLSREAAVGAVERVRAGADIGTAAQPLGADDWRNPNRVKVDVDGHGHARRFYRGPRPPPPAPAAGRRAATLLHVGVYACRRATLARWLALPPEPEEPAERLEQVRPLRHGLTIGVRVLADAVPHGIDTEDDLRRAEARL